ncbi:hypothetical protein IFM89_026533, partial [Coptis chinensis]
MVMCPTRSSEYPMDLDTKPPALVSSDSSVKVPLCTDPILHGPFPRYHDDVKLVSKDDDENSYGCTQPSTVTLKTFRAPPRIGDHRDLKAVGIRGSLESCPKLKDGDLFNSDGDMKPVFLEGKKLVTRQSKWGFMFTVAAQDSSSQSKILMVIEIDYVSLNDIGPSTFKEFLHALIFLISVKLDYQVLQDTELFIEIRKVQLVGSP